MNPNKEPEVKKLSSIVNYQEGTIVSTTIINKEAGTVTIFAFDKEQGLSEHTAPFDAMIIILDGDAEITISKKPYQLTTGDSIIMPANEPHAVQAITSFKMILIMIKSK